MARYIDADALIQKIDEGNKSLLTSALAMTVIKITDDIPTADVVEVVRCKDCVHYNNKACRKLHTMQIKRTDFCSFGERRE